MNQPFTVDPAVALLVDAGVVLASSLDPATTMRQVAELTVPRLADLCVIDLLDSDQLIRDVAVVAQDPQTASELEQLRRVGPIDPAGSHPVARVLRSGSPELLTQMTPGLLRSFAAGDAHARFMIGHRYHSAVVAPLRARDRTLGTLSVLRLGDGEPYGPEELELTCELARRAALAIDNARLYADLSGVEQRLEAILSSVAEAITVIDHTGRTVYANQAAADLLKVDKPADLTSSRPGSIMDRFRVFRSWISRACRRGDCCWASPSSRCSSATSSWRPARSAGSTCARPPSATRTAASFATRSTCSRTSPR